MNITKSVTKEYHKEWKKKILDSGRIEYQMRAVNTIARLFEFILNKKFSGKTLDIGCGDGALVEALNRNSSIQAKGIDIEDGVNFETDQLPFADNEFQNVIMYSVLEHLYQPGNILVEVKRILVSRGHVILVLPNIKTTKEVFFDDPTHVHPYSPTSVKILMNLFKFEKNFIGLWTVGKSSTLWKLPENLQFFIGKHLPWAGNVRFAPSFLKGKSTTMVCVFQNIKNEESITH